MPKKPSAPKKYNVPTTNFIIDVDKIDTDFLQEKFELLTIEVPTSYRFSPDPNKYAKLHNTYKEQLELPYYFYSYAKPEATIFIVKDKSKSNDEPIFLTFEFLKGEKVQAQKRAITELYSKENLHILAKLFLSDCFYNHKKKYRICQGKFYVHSRINRGGNSATVLEISGLNHIGKNEFCFNQKATFMLKADRSKIKPQFISSDIYCELVDGEIYYRQVKTSYVKKWLADKTNTKELWMAFTGSRTSKPSIKWFEAYDNILRCKSTLLQNFQAKLLNHYNKTLGSNSSKQQVHNMTQIQPITPFNIQGYGKGTGLFLNLLGKVGLLDLRLKKDNKNANQIPFQTYIDFFNKHYKYSTIKNKFEFIEIKKENLRENKNPILVLQDVEKQLFEQEEKDNKGKVTKSAGFLFRTGFFNDPKQELYSEFATEMPLQTININTNDAKDHTIDTYFDYEMLGECLKSFGDTYEEIALNLVIQKKQLKELYKADKKRFGEASENTKERGKHYRKLKNHFSLVTNKIDVCLNELLLKHYIINQIPIKGNSDNPNYFLPCIIKFPKLLRYSYMYQNIFMYVDEQNVLRFLNLDNPDEKQKRNNLLKKLEIDWFDFDEKFAIRNYTRRENGENRTYKKNGEIRDKHEEGLKKTHFIFAKGLALAIEDTEERVFHIYDPEKKGKSQRHREQTTALQGIFFSREKQIYTVGYKSLDITADRSVKVRKLHYYQNSENLKIDDLLQTLSVEFVRNKQYTVYPYFFDLLNLYRNDVLQTE